MKFFVVDDEKFALDRMVRELKTASPKSEVFAFSKYDLKNEASEGVHFVNFDSSNNFASFSSNFDFILSRIDSYNS